MSQLPQRPRIAIALATYNGDAFLREMLDSLVAQTLQPWRVVAVDDGSTDASPAILEEYRDRLPLQIHLNAQNSGHRAAFSTALEYCRDADLVALADQDDIWLPEKLSTLATALGPADLVHSDARTIHADGSPRDPSWHALMELPASQGPEPYLVGFNNVTGCTALFRSALLDRALPIPAGTPVHDWWLALHAALGQGIAYVDRPLVLYRLHGGNAVGEGKQTETLRASLEKRQRWYRTLLDAPRLPLGAEQRQLVQRLLQNCSARLERFWVPADLPWLWSRRNLLFPPPASPGRRLLQILMSLIGVRTARLLGKRG